MVEEPLFKEIAISIVNKHNLQYVDYVDKGAFKETYHVIGDKGKDIALKIFDPSKCSLTRSSRELAAARRCNSPYIAKLIDNGTFKTSNGTEILFCLEEFLDGGTLNDKIYSGNLNHKIVRSYAITLIKALNHLKLKDLVHRDIKPDNIMFRVGLDEPVLVDFGIVRDLTMDSYTKTWLPRGPGTPFYSAPEQLLNDKPLISWRTDQFSIGVVLSVCLIGRHPYKKPDMNDIDIIESVSARNQCPTQFIKQMDDLGFNCVVRMIDPWPIRRFQTPEQLIEQLNMGN